MPRPESVGRQVDNFHLLGDPDLKTEAAPTSDGFASAAENEARLRTIAALGVSAASTIRVRGHRHRGVPVTPALKERWEAGELDELLSSNDGDGPGCFGALCHNERCPIHGGES